MSIERRHKYSTELRYLTFDFSAKAASGTTLTDPQVSVAPTGLTLGTPTVNGQYAQVSVSAGADLTDYTVTMKVTASNGEVLVGKSVVAVNDSV